MQTFLFVVFSLFSPLSYADQPPLQDYIDLSNRRQLLYNAKEAKARADKAAEESAHQVRKGELRAKAQTEIAKASAELVSLQNQRSYELNRLTETQNAETSGETINTQAMRNRHQNERSNAEFNRSNALNNLNGLSVSERSRLDQEIRSAYNSEIRRISSELSERETSVRTALYLRNSNKSELQTEWDSKIRTQRFTLESLKSQWNEALRLHQSNHEFAASSSSNQTNTLNKLNAELAADRSAGERAQREYERARNQNKAEEIPLDTTPPDGVFGSYIKWSVPGEPNQQVRYAEGPSGRVVNYITLGGTSKRIPRWVKSFWVTDELLIGIAAASRQEVNAFHSELKNGPEDVRKKIETLLLETKKRWVEERLPNELEALEAEKGEISRWLEEQYPQIFTGPQERALPFFKNILSTLAEDKRAPKNLVQTRSEEIGREIGKRLSSLVAVPPFPLKEVGNLNPSELKTRYAQVYQVQADELSLTETGWEKQWQEYVEINQRTGDEARQKIESRKADALEMLNRGNVLLSLELQELGKIETWKSNQGALIQSARQGDQEQRARLLAAAQAAQTEAFGKAVPEALSSGFSREQTALLTRREIAIEQRQSALQHHLDQFTQRLQALTSELFEALLRGESLADVQAGWTEKLATIETELARQRSDALAAIAALPSLDQSEAEANQWAAQTLKNYREFAQLRDKIEQQRQSLLSALAREPETLEKNWRREWFDPLVERYLSAYEKENGAVLLDRMPKFFALRPSDHFVTALQAKMAAAATGPAARKTKTTRWSAQIDQEKQRLTLALKERLRRLNSAYLAWEKAAQTQVNLELEWARNAQQHSQQNTEFETTLLAEWNALKPSWEAGPSMAELWDSEMASYPRYHLAEGFASVRRGTRYDLSQFLEIEIPDNGGNVILGEVGKVIDLAGEAPYWVAVVDGFHPAPGLTTAEEFAGVPGLQALVFNGSKLLAVSRPPRPSLDFGRGFLGANTFVLPIYHEGVLVPQLAQKFDLKSGEVRLGRLTAGQEPATPLPPPFPY